jgi:hypothetical protein
VIAGKKKPKDQTKIDYQTNLILKIENDRLKKLLEEKENTILRMLDKRFEEYSLPE